MSQPEPKRTFERSNDLQERARSLIPGGSHTYAKGADQYPVHAPGVLLRGKGCRVWDADGNEFIEYGMGCRAVSLGHAFAPVCDAVAKSLSLGTNFTRPAAMELECAEKIIGLVRGAEMVKFTKDGSAATTAALKIARAATGRDLIAFCSDHPYFASNDWFIGKTKCNAGIPEAVSELSLTFRFNDLASVEALFAKYPNQIAAIILEPSRGEDPKDNFLHRVQELCRIDGALFILDEMITGFRWDTGGAQQTYDIVPDLSCFGKAMANGFSVSALLGKREFMELGGLDHLKPRVFLLSTTHGGEIPMLAAAIATMDFYQANPVIERLHDAGKRLRLGVNEKIEAHGLEDNIQIMGRDCNLVFTCKDQNLQPCQAFRSLLIQELIQNGILAPSFVVSYSHTDADIDQTVEAMGRAMAVYARALDDGVDQHLIGRPSKVVMRTYN